MEFPPLPPFQSLKKKNNNNLGLFIYVLFYFLQDLDFVQLLSAMQLANGHQNCLENKLKVNKMRQLKEKQNKTKQKVDSHN